MFPHDDSSTLASQEFELVLFLDVLTLSQLTMKYKEKKLNETMAWTEQNKTKKFFL